MLQRRPSRAPLARPWPFTTITFGTQCFGSFVQLGTTKLNLKTKRMAAAVPQAWSAPAPKSYRFCQARQQIKKSNVF